MKSAEANEPNQLARAAEALAQALRVHAQLAPVQHQDPDVALPALNSITHAAEAYSEILLEQTGWSNPLVFADDDDELDDVEEDENSENSLALICHAVFEVNPRQEFDDKTSSRADQLKSIAQAIDSRINDMLYSIASELNVDVADANTEVLPVSQSGDE